MNNTQHFYLYHSESYNQSYIEANITNGELLINGQCFLNSNEDYEYWYQFDKKNTDKIFNIMSLEEFKKSFGGVHGCESLRSFCIAYDIHFSFNSYS